MPHDILVFLLIFEDCRKCKGQNIAPLEGALSIINSGVHVCRQIFRNESIIGVLSLLNLFFSGFDKIAIDDFFGIFKSICSILTR